MLMKIQPDATVCRYLFTAKSLYIFRVSQHLSSGVLKTVTAASGTGHNSDTATSLQRGLSGTLLHLVGFLLTVFSSLFRKGLLKSQYRSSSRRHLTEKSLGTFTVVQLNGIYYNSASFSAVKNKETSDMFGLP